MREAGIILQHKTGKQQPPVHYTVENARSKGLLPTCLNVPLEVRPLSESLISGWVPPGVKTFTSTALIAQLSKMGFSISNHVLGRHFRFLKNKGVPRSITNEEFLNGHSPRLYKDISHFSEVRDGLMKVLPDIIDILSPHSEEDGDIGKITIQRGIPPYWYLIPPVSHDAIFEVPAIWEDTCKRVVARYTRAVSWRGDFPTSVVTDFDPLDTNCGFPTTVSGDNSPLARVSTFDAFPQLDLSGNAQSAVATYLKGANQICTSVGLPDGLAFHAIINRRFGPFKKVTPDWRAEGAGGVSVSQGTRSLWPRMRHVFIIPFWLNVLISRSTLQQKSARRGILGLWHDPNHEALYLKHLQSYKGITYESDLSAQDTRITPPFRKVLFGHLLNAGFDPLGLQVKIQSEEFAGVTYPSWTGTADEATVLKGPVGMLSGWKDTSETDSLYGLITCLTSLRLIDEKYLTDWEKGSFVILSQGDDILFKSKKEIDPDVYAEGLKYGGAVGELVKGKTFLRKILPTDAPGPSVPLISRLIQQTFYNEQDYTDDVIPRLALTSRAQGLDKHPKWSKVAPLIIPLIESLAAFSNVGRKGADLFRFLPEDEEALTRYMKKHPGVIAELLARAEFQQSAADQVAVLKKIGFSLDDGSLPARQLRLESFKRMMTKPSAGSLGRLEALLPS